MSAGRDDSRLMQIVLDIRGRVQAHPNPAAWLDGQERAFALEGVDDPGRPPAACCWTTRGGRGLLAGQDRRALELCPCDANLDANYAPSLCHPGGPGRLCGGDAAGGTRPGRPAHPLRRRAQEDGGLPRRGGAGEGHPEHLQKADGEAGEWFEDCGADLLEDLRAVHPAVRGLFALVKDFEGPMPPRRPPPGHGGLRRSGAHGGAPAGGEDELPPSWPASGPPGTTRSWWTSTRTPTRCRTPSSPPCPGRGGTSSWWGM